MVYKSGTTDRRVYSYVLDTVVPTTTQIVDELGVSDLIRNRVSPRVI